MANRLPDDYVPNKIRSWLDPLVYARAEYKDVMTMILAVTHVADTDDTGPFTTVPEVLVTAKIKGSGKSTFAYDIPMMLAYNAQTWGKDDTEPALQHMFTGRDRLTLVLDDVGKIFGDSGNAGKLSKVYSVLIKCYRRGATTKMSRNQVTVDVPTFCVAFMNGLHKAVPEDLFDRSIVFPFRKAPSGYKLRDALSPVVQAEGDTLREALHAWATARRAVMARFMQRQVYLIHPKLEQRRAQIWGPVFAAAHAAGGDWPRRIFEAFVLMALDAGERPVPVPEQQVLLDTAGIIMRRDIDQIFTGDLITELRELPDGDFYRKADDGYLATSLLPVALGPSAVIRGKMLHGEHAGLKGRAKGWDAIPVLKAAADLRDMLYPPMAPIGPDETDAELAFEPAPPSPRLMAASRDEVRK